MKINNENDLNIEYICNKTLLDKNDELVPIILDMIKESYKAGLCQTEYDNTIELMKENNKLKKQIEDANEKIILLQASEPMLNYKKALEETQQKEFIKYLEDEIQNKREKSTTLTAFIRNVVPLQQCLQKYKEIIGDDK